MDTEIRCSNYITWTKEMEDGQTYIIFIMGFEIYNMELNCVIANFVGKTLSGGFGVL